MYWKRKEERKILKKYFKITYNTTLHPKMISIHNRIKIQF